MTAATTRNLPLPSALVITIATALLVTWLASAFIRKLWKLR
jgi:hypothetical protein